ncbi:MAG: Rossmann-like domain-containing protein [Vulcanimicrobiota bacterium]
MEQKLMEIALTRMEGLTVEDIRLGLGYTAVKNSAGGTGLAYTLRGRLPSHCGLNPLAGSMIGMGLEEAARKFIDPRNVINASIGLAAVNSVLNNDVTGYSTGDITNILDVKNTDWVGMVGHFKPVENQLKKVTPHVFVVDDKQAYLEEEKYNSFYEILSKCQIIIITATTLINKTLNDILGHTGKARKKALLGPSTPLNPTVFKNTGIDILSGMIVENSDKVLEIVSQGGGTMLFKKHCQKINININ